MRRRWKIDWRYLKALAAAYFVVGLLAVFAALFIWRNKDRYGYDQGTAWVHSPIHWMLPVWLALIVVPALAFGAYHAARWMRRNPFIRRVSEPVVKDLREAHRDV